MYCSRCGRQVNNNANFCGGCGLSKKEIDDQLARTNTYNYTAPVFEPAPPQTGEVEKFVERPFPTDVEFKEVPAEAWIETPTVEIDVQEVVAQAEQGDAPQEQQSEQTAQDQYGASQNQYRPSQEQYQEEILGKNKPNESLSTVDFVWMILLTLIPGVNLIYLFYQAVIQNNNINRRSYARAVFIVAFFVILIMMMFAFGFFMANLIY